MILLRCHVWAHCSSAQTASASPSWTQTTRVTREHQRSFICLWLGSKSLFSTVNLLNRSSALLLISECQYCVTYYTDSLESLWSTLSFQIFTEHAVSNTPLGPWEHAVRAVLQLPYSFPVEEALFHIPLASSWPPIMGKHSQCLSHNQWPDPIMRTDVRLFAHAPRSLFPVFQKASSYHDLRWEKLVSGTTFLFSMSHGKIS